MSLDPLTDREAEVVRALWNGWSNARIADELSVAVTTVKSHLARINEKLGTNSRVEIALWHERRCRREMLRARAFEIAERVVREIEGGSE